MSATLPTADTEDQSPVDAARAKEWSARPCDPPADVPGYRIQSCLGEGAYGSVWLAFEQHTGKHVAIKFYAHRGGVDWSLLHREVEKLAVLYTNRNIVGLLDVGWDADPPYYIMEYLVSGSLAGLLQKGPLPVAEALRIVRKILHALVHAHGAGILHCDLKPANVLLDGDFEPRLADFGQSRLSHEQQPALGTLFYMAPEQADLHAVPDTRWDVYALGAVLYQTLTGEVPHRTVENERRLAAAGSLEERLHTYRRLLAEGPRPVAVRKMPGVDRRLAEIVERCLEIDPERRFPNAQSVLDALDARDRTQQRRPWLLLGILGPALMLIAMVPVAHYAFQDAIDAAERTLVERALESDAVAVRILAHSIENDLADRMAELQEVANDPELAAAVLAEADLPWPDRLKLRAVLDRRRQQADAARLPHGRQRDSSWFVTDIRGRQLHRVPYSAETVDKVYARRDYFHGLQREFPEDQVPADIQPIRQPHVSLAFPSEATNQYMVAISVPVRSEGRVIGVLARTMHLGQLLAAYQLELGRRRAGQIERTIALVDDRDYELLDHPWMTAENLRSLPPKSFQSLRLAEPLRVQLRELRATSSRPEGNLALSQLDRSAEYADPLAQLDPQGYGGVWLAAFWPIAHTGWTAVVQERKEIALRPVVEMEAGLQRYARLGVALCGLLIAALWYFIFRAVSEASLTRRRRGKSLEEARTVTTSTLSQRTI